MTKNGLTLAIIQSIEASLEILWYRDLSSPEVMHALDELKGNEILTKILNWDYENNKPKVADSE